MEPYPEPYPSSVIDVAQRVAAEGIISTDAIESIVGFPPGALNGIYSIGVENQFSSDRLLRFASLIAQLEAVKTIRDDERVLAFFDYLFEQKFDIDNLSSITSIDANDLTQFLDDPTAVSPALKYEIAVRISYLRLAVANASAPG